MPTLAELKKLASSRKIRGRSKMNKAQLLRALTKSRKLVKKKSRKPRVKKSRKPKVKKSRKSVKKSRKPRVKKPRKPRVKKPRKLTTRPKKSGTGRKNSKSLVKFRMKVADLVTSSGMISCDEFIKAEFVNNPGNTWKAEFGKFKYILNLPWYDKPQGEKGKKVDDFTYEEVLGGQYGSHHSIRGGTYPGGRNIAFHGMVPYEYTDRRDVSGYSHQEIFFKL